MTTLLLAHAHTPATWKSCHTHTNVNTNSHPPIPHMLLLTSHKLWHMYSFYHTHYTIIQPRMNYSTTRDIQSTPITTNSFVPLSLTSYNYTICAAPFPTTPYMKATEPSPPTSAMHKSITSQNCHTHPWTHPTGSNYYYSYNPFWAHTKPHSKFQTLTYPQDDLWLPQWQSTFTHIFPNFTIPDLVTINNPNPFANYFTNSEFTDMGTYMSSCNSNSTKIGDSRPSFT